MTPPLIKISKFLSYVLRHKPESIGLSLTSDGWASIDDVILKSRNKGVILSRDLIDEVVFTNDKQRFAYSDDGLCIRANQGHTIAVDLQLKLSIPPDILFHGTIEVNLDAIRAKGLLKMKRNHVHLSADADTARRVGARRGKPIILKIDAKEMVTEGYAFFCSQNGVWLTESVPPSFIEGLSQ